MHRVKRKLHKSARAHTQTLTHNTCSRGAKAAVVSRAGLTGADKRSIHLITFNEGALINRCTLTR